MTGEIAMMLPEPGIAKGYWRHQKLQRKRDPPLGAAEESWPH